MFEMPVALLVLHKVILMDRNPTVFDHFSCISICPTIVVNVVNWIFFILVY